MGNKCVGKKSTLKGENEDRGKGRMQHFRSSVVDHRRGEVRTTHQGRPLCSLFREMRYVQRLLGSAGGAGQGSSGGLRDGGGKECSRRKVNAKGELRRARWRTIC